MKKVLYIVGFGLAAVAFYFLMQPTKKPQLVEMTLTWVPPKGYQQSGPVTVEGNYVADALSSPWGTLCSMYKADDGIYRCRVTIPSDAQLTFNVRHEDRGAYGSSCFVCDQSSDKPCGGRGTNFGNLKVLQNGKPLETSLLWNGTGPEPPNATFFNEVIVVP